MLLRATPSTARIDLVIRCRLRMFFATTCARMLTSPGSGAHRDDFWHRQEARQNGRVGLADPQGHERDELAAEGAEVKALAEGFERAVSGEMPQPGVDSQEPGEGEPFGIGERPAGSRGAVRNENRVGCMAAPEELAGPLARVERPGQHSRTSRWRSYGFCLMFSLG